MKILKHALMGLAFFLSISLNYASDADINDAAPSKNPAITSTFTSVGGGQGFLMRMNADGSHSILLARDTRFPDQLGCYGAAQGKGEFTDAAFMRGVQQKLGVSLDPNSVRTVASWQRILANSEGANDHCYFYTALIDADVTNNPEFLSEVSWHTLDELATRLSEDSDSIFTGVHPVLAHILKLHGATMEPQSTLKVPDFEHPHTLMTYHFMQ